MKKTIPPLLLAALLPCACAHAPQQWQAPPVKPPEQLPLEQSWNFNPSIERGLEILLRSPTGAEQAKKLERDRFASISYEKIAGPWPKYDPSSDKIYIQEYVRGLDYTISMQVSFAMALRDAYRELGLEDFTVEILHMAALKRLQTALELGIPFEEATKTPAGRQLLDEACDYVFGGRRTLLDNLERRALQPNDEYGFPYEQMSAIQRWVDKAEKISGGDEFVKAMYERDLQRARRGAISKGKADRNSSKLVSMSLDEMQVLQRDIGFVMTREVKEAQAKYSSALSAERHWAKTNAALLKKRAAEMSLCSFRTWGN